MMTMIDQSVLNQFGDRYQGYPLSLQALGERQWLVVLGAEPPCRLRLSAESELTRQLDQMGLSDENKVGDPQLDEAFVIRAETPEARAMLQNDAVVQTLKKLMPFVELELTHKEYRLIKDGVSPTSATIESVLQSLIELIEASGRQ